MAGRRHAGLAGTVQVVAIDMCAIFASAVRPMLPGARVAVDLFHVVQLAVKTADDVRRRAIRELYGRRGKSGDPANQRRRVRIACTRGIRRRSRTATNTRERTVTGLQPNPG